MLTAEQRRSLAFAIDFELEADREAESIREKANARQETYDLVAGWLEPLRPRYPAKGELPEVGVRVNFCLREKPEKILFGWKASGRGAWYDDLHGYPERDILCWWSAPTVAESKP